MTEPAAEIELLRAERDELRKDLLRRRGAIAWVMSDVYRQQHFDPDYPEHLSQWIDQSILRRLRQGVGWHPDGGEGRDLCSPDLGTTGDAPLA